MAGETIEGILAFLRQAERPKNVTRTAWTSEGHRESVAEHSWRLCLMALVLGHRFPHLDSARLMKMCVIHDLGEAIGGDISATLQPPGGEVGAGTDRSWRRSCSTPRGGIPGTSTTGSTWATAGNTPPSIR